MDSILWQRTRNHRKVTADFQINQIEILKLNKTSRTLERKKGTEERVRLR